MGALSGFKLNHPGIQSYLDGDHGVEGLLEARAAAVASAAKSSAPVDSGDYQASIHVETAHTDRMVKRVVADVSYAMVVEADTGNMARALDAAG
jgi:hypothetical protein